MSKQRTFITDLDHTLIHSQYPEHLCVERHPDRRPITYMTQQSYRLLLRVLMTPTIEVIPCTMRNWSQLQRIDWVQEYPPRLAICSNGAQIFVDGQLDEQWEGMMRERTPKQQVLDDYQKIVALDLKEVEIQKIEQFYLVVKCANVAYAKESIDVIKHVFAMRRQVFRSGRKIFVITPEIDKKYAVDYLRTHYDLPNIITSGDSIADRKFTMCGQAILPRHATFLHPQARLTIRRGIAATEEILKYVLKFE
ncbi:MAG: HAD family hydrolase [Culicoidibacterales bacterium]